MHRHAALKQELTKVPLFAGLADEDLDALAERVARIKEPAGVTFTKEGEHGYEFVLVLDGEVTVSHDGATVATLGPGDWFGELALLDDGARRSATVVSTTRVEVGFLDRHDFDVLLAEVPGFAERIRATAATRRAELEATS